MCDVSGDQGEAPDGVNSGRPPSPSLQERGATGAVWRMVTAQVARDEDAPFPLPLWGPCRDTGAWKPEGPGSSVARPHAPTSQRTPTHLVLQKSANLAVGNFVAAATHLRQVLAVFEALPSSAPG